MQLSLEFTELTLSDRDWQSELAADRGVDASAGNRDLGFASTRLDVSEKDVLYLDQGTDSSIWLQRNGDDNTHPWRLIKIYDRKINPDILDAYRTYTQRTIRAVESDPNFGTILVGNQVYELLLGVVPVGNEETAQQGNVFIGYERRNGWVGGCNVAELTSPKYPLHFVEVDHGETSSFIRPRPFRVNDAMFSDLVLRKMQNVMRRAAPPTLPAMNMKFVIEPSQQRVRLMITDLLGNIRDDAPRLVKKRR